MPLGPLEEDRRATGTQHPVTDLGHLQVRVDLDGDTLELAQAFQLEDEVTQVGVAHGAANGLD